MTKFCIQYIENKWKAETNQANELFNNQRFKKAEKHYKLALIQAELLLRNKAICKTCGIPIHDIFAISCNNLCVVYAELKQTDKEEKYYNLHFFYMLLQLRLNKSRAEVDLNLERSLNKISMLYIHFLKRVNNFTRISQIATLVEISVKQKTSLN